MEIYHGSVLLPDKLSTVFDSQFGRVRRFISTFVPSLAVYHFGFGSPLPCSLPSTKERHKAAPPALRCPQTATLTNRIVRCTRSGKPSLTESQPNSTNECRLRTKAGFQFVVCMWPSLVRSHGHLRRNFGLFGASIHRDFGVTSSGTACTPHSPRQQYTARPPRIA